MGSLQEQSFLLYYHYEPPKPNRSGTGAVWETSQLQTTLLVLALIRGGAFGMAAVWPLSDLFGEVRARGR